MITAELTKKIDLLPLESYRKVESFVEQLIVSDIQLGKEKAFQVFMDKMNVAEKSMEENGYYTEEEAEEELAKI
ncbi:MAG: hypothetical protein HDR25_05010 [Lachnospiraceae bacterium]|nr:hypothetical protein [Lachnospiraceae bacterium]